MLAVLEVLLYPPSMASVSSPQLSAQLLPTVTTCFYPRNIRAHACTHAKMPYSLPYSFPLSTLSWRWSHCLYLEKTQLSLFNRHLALCQGPSWVWLVVYRCLHCLSLANKAKVNNNPHFLNIDLIFIEQVPINFWPTQFTTCWGRTSEILFTFSQIMLHRTRGNQFQLLIFISRERC